MVSGYYLDHLSLTDQSWDEELSFGDLKPGTKDCHLSNIDQLVYQNSATIDGTPNPSYGPFNPPGGLHGSNHALGRLTTLPYHTRPSPAFPQSQNNSPEFKRPCHPVSSAQIGSDSDATSSSPDQVFSPTSPISSVSSSTEDGSTTVPPRQINQAGRSNRNAQPPSHGQQHLSTSLTSAGSTFAGSGHGRHPRRTHVSSSWTKPPLVRQQDNRHDHVDNLVGMSLRSFVELELHDTDDFLHLDSATQLVGLMWPSSRGCNTNHNKLPSLSLFIRETLRRSRTSYSTLQVTLWYLVHLKVCVLRKRKAMGESITAGPEGEFQDGNNRPSSLPLGCGRRMFLSALILASKYLQDRNFTARAWSKITGLAATEIVVNETTFLSEIRWNLHLRHQDYLPWNYIILRCTYAPKLGHSRRETWFQVLRSLYKGSTLGQTASYLELQKSYILSNANRTSSGQSSRWGASDASSFPSLSPQASFQEVPPVTAERKFRDQTPNAAFNLRPTKTPTLEGRLKTPALPPGPVWSTLSTPAAGIDGLPGRFSSSSCLNRSNAEAGFPVTSSWETVRTEFPMDMVQTPQTMSNNEGTKSPDVPAHWLRNKAFGLLTPSSSFDPGTSTAHSSVGGTSFSSFGSASSQSSYCSTRPEGDSRMNAAIDKNGPAASGPSQDLHRAAAWIDMLAEAAHAGNGPSVPAPKHREQLLPIAPPGTLPRRPIKRSETIYGNSQLVGRQSSFGGSSDAQQSMRADCALQPGAGRLDPPKDTFAAQRTFCERQVQGNLQRASDASGISPCAGGKRSASYQCSKDTRNKARCTGFAMV